MKTRRKSAWRCFPARISSIQHNVLQTFVFFEGEFAQQGNVRAAHRLVRKLFCGKDHFGRILQIFQFGQHSAALARAHKIAAAPHFQVVFGNFEPVRVVFDDGQPLARLRGIAAHQQEAVALFAAPAHPAAQLVQLGKAEPFGIVDDHDGGVGDVHPHFDDGGGDEAIVLLILERLHDLRLFLVLHLAVQEGEPHAREAVFQLVEKLGDADERTLLVPLDLGADEVALVAQLCLFADVFKHIVVLARRHDARDDLRTRLGLVLDLGNVQIAVKDEGEGARNGGGGHDQHIGARTLFPQRAALGNAEAVLFVAHAQREVFGLHVRLQHGVRAADDVDLPRCQPLFDGRLFPCGRAARKKRDAVFGEIFLQEREVLRGEHLGGRQKGALVPAFDRHVQRAQRHRRLAAAHVPLQQPVHAGGSLQVGVHVVHRLFLALGELEGKAHGEVRHVRRRAGIGAQADVLLAPLDETEGGNEDKVLLQRDARAPFLPLGKRLRGVHLAVRLRQRGKGVLSDELGRDCRDDGDLFQRVRHRVAHRPLRERAAQRIHGNNAFKAVIFFAQLERGVDHGGRSHAVTVLHPAVKEVFLPRFQVFLHVRRIEPDGGKAFAALVAPYLDKGPAARIHRLRRRRHAAGEQHHVVVIALRDLYRLREVEIVAREKAHEVFRSENIQFVEVLFPLFGNAPYLRKFHIGRPLKENGG